MMQSAKIGEFLLRGKTEFKCIRW